MKALTQAVQGMWYYKLAIAWAFFFTVNSIGTVMLATLTNVQWNELDPQSKMLIVVGMLVNWTATMMAFLSRIVHRLVEGKPLMEDTEIIKKP